MVQNLLAPERIHMSSEVDLDDSILKGTMANAIDQVFNFFRV